MAEDSNSATTKKQNNATDQRLENLKKEHPERVVDGVYYEDDTKLKEAKEAYAKKVEAATAAAKATAEEKASKRAAAANKINAALYGEGSDITSAQMKQTVGGIELDAVIGNAEAVQARQHLLNPEDYEDDVKSINPGKMPNNEDAYPVDLKIEELETHKPDVKIHEVTTHVHGQAAAMAAMKVGDTAEKRIIHLENIVATLMRYVFRLGSRVHINCVYYGGQSPFEKYKCIRCMQDDRISDGQMIQIDQCLNCTRYEPVFGKLIILFFYQSLYR